MKEYLSLFIKNKEIEIYSVATGANWLNINTDLLKNYIVPVPPIDEQKIMVKKVYQLMNKCQLIEQEVEKNEQYTNQLIQAVLKEAFSSEKEEVNDSKNVEV
ncbi:hypothetical protein CRYO30217_02980 [Parvicella tangerina]|uniref:Type I restriction modification DNA specificity domain-containing protein n=1 Tax=Parvicella tangerina TaxID=2829795 RepID=A0A916JPN8_9FLAO|nr:hypothetical protein CRYO30217_02980 [Parvicella tangerina]